MPADDEGGRGVVLAEAVKFDTGDLVLLLLLGLVSLVVTVVGVATIATSIGFAVGRALLRRRHSGVTPGELRPGSRVQLVLGAVLATVVSAWLGWAVMARANGAGRLSGILLYGVAMLLPAAWGLHNGLTRSFPPSGRRPPSPDRSPELRRPPDREDQP